MTNESICIILIRLAAGLALGDSRTAPPAGGGGEVVRVGGVTGGGVTGGGATGGGGGEAGAGPVGVGRPFGWPACASHCLMSFFMRWATCLREILRRTRLMYLPKRVD